MICVCSIEKIFELEKHVGTAISGLSADARTLVEHARLEALNHAFTYGEPMRVCIIVDADCLLEHTKERNAVG